MFPASARRRSTSTAASSGRAWLRLASHQRGAGAAARRFVAQSEGGSIRLADDGSPMLDYELSDYVWEGVRRAYLDGRGPVRGRREQVRAAHIDARYQTSWTEAKKGIAELPLKKFRATLFTAPDGRLRDERERGARRRRQSRPAPSGRQPVGLGRIGVPDQHRRQPQLSIYGVTAQNASALAKDLALRARPAPGAAAQTCRAWVIGHRSHLANWRPDAPRSAEILFVVARVVLQDFTGVPLLADLAAMRSRRGNGPATRRRSSRWCRSTWWSTTRSWSTTTAPATRWT